jgi:hypothetical protein
MVFQQRLGCELARQGEDANADFGCQTDRRVANPQFEPLQARSAQMICDSPAYEGGVWFRLSICCGMMILRGCVTTALPADSETER